MVGVGESTVAKGTFPIPVPKCLQGKLSLHPRSCEEKILNFGALNKMQIDIPINNLKVIF
jgi:hypothetical protein